MIGICRTLSNDRFFNICHRNRITVATLQHDAVGGLGIVVLFFRSAVGICQGKDQIHIGADVIRDAILTIAGCAAEGCGCGILVIHILAGLHVVAVHCLHQLRQIGSAAGGFVHNVVQRAVVDGHCGFVASVGDHNFQLLIVIVGSDSGGIGKVIKPSLGIIKLAIGAILTVDGDGVIVDLGIPVVHFKIEPGVNLRTEDQRRADISYLF